MAYPRPSIEYGRTSHDSQHPLLPNAAAMERSQTPLRVTSHRHAPQSADAEAQAAERAREQLLHRLESDQQWHLLQLAKALFKLKQDGRKDPRGLATSLYNRASSKVPALKVIETDAMILLRTMWKNLSKIRWELTINRAPHAQGMGIYPHKVLDDHFTYSTISASKGNKSKPSYKISRHNPDGSGAGQRVYFSNEVFEFSIRDAAKSANIAWSDDSTGDIKLLGFSSESFPIGRVKALETIGHIAFPRDPNSTAFNAYNVARISDLSRLR